MQPYRATHSDRVEPKPPANSRHDMSRKRTPTLLRILKEYPIMTTPVLFVAAGLLATSLTPSFADSVSATVASWDGATRTITLDDRWQFADIPAEASCRRSGLVTR